MSMLWLEIVNTLHRPILVLVKIMWLKDDGWLALLVWAHMWLRPQTSL